MNERLLDDASCASELKRIRHRIVAVRGIGGRFAIGFREDGTRAWSMHVCEYGKHHGKQWDCKAKE